MRQDQLPSPGQFSGSQRLLSEVVKAISFTEIADSYRSKGSGPCAQAESLHSFLQAAADHVKPMTKRSKTKSTPEKE